MLIPIEVCEGIERKMNGFWWGNGSANRGIRWLSWDKLCDTKEEGGLGVKKLRDFNVAMLAKQGWRLIKDTNSLVTKLMKARYYSNSDFLNAELGNNPSYVWRSILEAQWVIRQGCRRRIGDGCSTKVWQVPWLPCPSNGCLTTTMPAELALITVQDLMMDGQPIWDDEVLQDICNDRDRELIKRVPIPMRSRADGWFWLLEEDGEFSVRSCYRRIQGQNDNSNETFWKRLWSLKLPGKIVNFLWRACKSVLPTCTELVKKRVEVDGFCPLCRICEEDAVHVLFECKYAREIWEAVGLWDLIVAGIHRTVLSTLQQVFIGGTTDQCVMVGLFCWSIWNRRNKWVWDRVTVSIFGAKTLALNLLKDWRRAREEECKEKRLRNATGVRSWVKPPEGWIKVNVDTACGQRYVGVGGVVRDEHGEFLRARCNVVHGSMKPREAEAVGLKEVLSWVKDWRSSRCIFETDAKVVVDAINGRRGSSYFDTIVLDCIELLKHFEEVLVVFAYRSANNVAHTLVRAAYSMSGLQEWIESAPDFIGCNIAIEK